MHYWGVIMRGVREDDLSWNTDGLYDLTEELDGREFTVSLPNGKNVLLDIEISEDENYIGFHSGYPWDEHTKGLEEKDIDDALVQFLTPYVENTEEEIRSKIDYISTYNCC